MLKIPNRLRESARKLALVAVLLSASEAPAQITLGDAWNLQMDGSLGWGYSGSSGSTRSSHSHGFTGHANLEGSYFHPNFMSFQFRPYYDRTQNNSESQTINRSTGFGGSTSFFGGSRFPGSVSYGRSYTTNQQFWTAGVPTVTGDGTSSNFGVSWSLLFPERPTLHVSYGTGAGSSTIADSQASENKSKMLNMDSNYRLGGWDLSGMFSRHSYKYETSAIFGGEALASSGSGNTYSATAQHSLPLSGSLSLGWTRASFTSGDNTHNSTAYSAGTSFVPFRRLSVYQNAVYRTDLAAALALAIGTPAAGFPDFESSGIFYQSGATYQIGWGFTGSAYFNHRVQSFAGRRYADSQYGGTVSYNHNSRLFGFLYFGLGVVDTVNRFGNQGTGLNATVGATKKLWKWETTADYNYTQQLQTVGSLRTTSAMLYGVTTNRKFSEDTRVNASFRGSKSGFALTDGSGNHGESFSSGLFWRRYGVTANYSQSDGVAVLTRTGELTATPIGELITPDVVLFDATSYSFGVQARYFSRLGLYAGYAKFDSSTVRPESGLFTSGERYNAQLDWRLRRFAIRGGYSRSMQDISTVTTGPRVVNSFYINFSRWFDVF